MTNIPSMIFKTLMLHIVNKKTQRDTITTDRSLNEKKKKERVRLHLQITFKELKLFGFHRQAEKVAMSLSRQRR